VQCDLGETARLIHRGERAALDARRRRRDEVELDAVAAARARRTCGDDQQVVWLSTTNDFRPERTMCAPSGCANAAMPSASQRPAGSACATVAVVVPAAMPGSHSTCCAAVPPTTSALAARQTVEKKCAQRSAAPIASISTISST
jgi:hypothetical protein